MLIRVYKILAAVLLIGLAGCASQKGPSLSTWGMDETKVFTLRPGADRERNFGSVGVTGIDLRIYPGMVLKVEKVTPGSPADGHIQPGEVIQAVKGTPELWSRLGTRRPEYQPRIYVERTGERCRHTGPDQPIACQRMWGQG